MLIHDISGDKKTFKKKIANDLQKLFLNFIILFKQIFEVKNSIFQKILYKFYIFCTLEVLLDYVFLPNLHIEGFLNDSLCRIMVCILNDFIKENFAIIRIIKY